jgi:hypothetical protein
MLSYRWPDWCKLPLDEIKLILKNLTLAEKRRIIIPLKNEMHPREAVYFAYKEKEIHRL